MARQARITDNSEHVTLSEIAGPWRVFEGRPRLTSGVGGGRRTCAQDSSQVVHATLNPLSASARSYRCLVRYQAQDPA